MDNGGDILQLCRLCLVKDDVNIPIFAEQGDIRQIFLKISSCLPVKVSREDKLPKKICDGCSYKLDMLYEFWNTTANAEKQLLSWLGEAGINAKLADGTISAVAQQIKPVETFVKQEAIDPSDIHTEDDDDKSYMFQQKFSVGEAGPSATVTSNDEPPPKRARRTAAVKAQIAMDPESDDDDDSGEPLTKVEDESEDSDGEDHEPPFVDVPSTSADDQPGPSGVGKDGAEAPYQSIKNDNIIKEEHILQLIGEEIPIDDMKDEDFMVQIEPNGQQPERKYLNKNDKPQEKKTTQDIKLPPLKQFDKPLKCGKCTKTFTNNLDFALHSIEHSDDKKYHCHICSTFKIACKHTIELHIRAHELPSKYKCKNCHKPIRKALAMDHKEEVERFSLLCDVCGKTFSCKENLHKHLRKHTGHKPHKCKSCPKAFNEKQNLVEHERIHTGERPFVCKHCNKSFNQRTPLKVHERIHTGEKPYKCRFCEKGYTSKGALDGHIRNCNGK